MIASLRQRRTGKFSRLDFGPSHLRFVRSSPGITTALVGMSHVEHVRANAKLVGVAPATVDQFSKLFSRGESA